MALLRRRRPRLARELVALIVQARVTKTTFGCGMRRQWRFHGTLMDDQRHGIERCWYKPLYAHEPAYPIDEILYERGGIALESGRSLNVISPFFDHR